MRAMQSGEIHGACGFYVSSISSSYAKHWKSGDLNSVVQLDINGKAKMFEKATPLSELLQTDEQKQMAKFVFGVDVLSRPVLASPRLKPADVKLLRRAFINTMRDPGLQADMAERFKVKTNPMRGEDVQRFFANMEATPRHIVEKVWQMTRPKKSNDR